MTNIEIFDLLDNVLSIYSVKQENKDFIYGYLEGREKEENLVYLEVEEPGELTWNKTKVLLDLFDKISIDKNIYGKILRFFYYLYRKDIFKVAAIKEQFGGLDKDNIKDTMDKLEEYSLPPEYYVAGFVSFYSDNYYNYITRTPIKQLEYIYELDKSILYKAVDCIENYFARKYIDICLASNERPYKVTIEDSNVDFYLTFYDKEDRDKLDRYIEQSIDKDIPFEKVKDIKASEDGRFKVLAILTKDTDSIFVNSAETKTLQFYREIEELEFIDYGIFLEKDQKDVNLFAQSIVHCLEYSFGKMAKYMIGRYVETHDLKSKVCKSFKEYKLLFDINKKSLTQMIDREKMNSYEITMYAAYGILAKNEGGDYINSFEKELIELLKKKLFLKLQNSENHVYYEEFDAFIKGKKRIEDIKEFPRDALSSIALYNTFMFIVMIVTNLSDTVNKILGYMLYRECLMDKNSYTFDRSVRLVGIKNIMSIMESIDMPDYMICNILISYAAYVNISEDIEWNYESNVHKRRESINVELERFIKDSVTSRVFNKIEMDEKESKYLLNIASALYKDSHISIECYKNVMLRVSEGKKGYLGWDVVEKLKELGDENIVLEFLDSKKVGKRSIGVFAAEAMNTPTIQNKLKEIYNRDRSSKLKETVAKILGLEVPFVQKKEVEIFDKKVTKRTIKKFLWLDIENMPKLKDKSGKELPDDYKYRLLNEYSMDTEIHSCESKNIVKETIDMSSLIDFSNKVVEEWIALDSLPKNKWVLSLFVDFGDYSTLAILEKAIKFWASNNKAKMAECGIKVLALSEREEDVELMVKMAKQDSKIGAIAGVAMWFVTRNLGLTKFTYEDLRDRVIPNMGFDKYGRKDVNYGSRNITIDIDTDHKIKFIKEDGKQVKRLPNANKYDDAEKVEKAKEELKQIKKQLKSIVKEQTERLKDALLERRQWTFSGWEKVFVDNAVMQKFAVSLVWGIYEDKKLIKAFRYIEDGSFVDIDEEDIDIKNHQKIALLFCQDLNKKDYDRWKEHLEDYEIIQPIEQFVKRLEDVLSERELWTVREWKEVFRYDKYMNRFTSSLVWGIYDNNKKLERTFTDNKYGCYVDSDDRFIRDLHRYDKIGLVRAEELRKDEFEKWKVYLEVNEIVQPIDQL